MRAVSTPSRPVRRPAHAPGQRSWGTRLVRGHPRDPAWARPALLGLLVGTAVLYLAGLSRSGYANEFYAAAVQAGTKSWKAFLFGSLDSSNFITVDKTPASLWVMELSGRAFGFSSWSLLAPQALEGVAAVGVLYATVRRWSGPAAATIAGAVLALTPVAVLMFRFDNPDALLVLVMTLAAYTITRAVESGLTRWVALTGALLGLGYLTKMLQAFLVLPAFALVYLWAGQPSLGRRLWQLLAGLAALVAAAGWWVAIDLLTPAAGLPYVGGSTDNNILQLTFGYNGLGRITGGESSAGGGGGTAARLGEDAARLGAGAARAGGGPTGGGGSMFGGATGIGRLFASDMGSQISWLLPAALITLAALLWLSRRSPRTDPTRAAALLWGGWLVVTGVVFSYMSGIIHPYYTVALAPAIAALAGIGTVVLWRIRHTWAARVTLAGALLVTAAWAWALLDRSPSWLPWLRVAIAIAAAAAAAMILAGPALRGASPRRRTLMAAAPLVLALAAGLGGPLAYSAATAATAHTGSTPQLALPWPAPPAGPAAASRAWAGSRPRRGVRGRESPPRAGRAISAGRPGPHREKPRTPGPLGEPSPPGRRAGRAAPAGRAASAAPCPRCSNPGRQATGGRRPRSGRKARPHSNWAATGSRSSRSAASPAVTRPRPWPSSRSWSPVTRSITSWPADPAARAAGAEVLGTGRRSPPG